jgi:hypothetical protein
VLKARRARPAAAAAAAEAVVVAAAGVAAGAAAAEEARAVVISLLVMTRRLLNERAQYGLADRGDVFLARGMERGLVLRMLSLNILGVLAAAK